MQTALGADWVVALLTDLKDATHLSACADRLQAIQQLYDTMLRAWLQLSSCPAPQAIPARTQALARAALSKALELLAAASKAAGGLLAVDVDTLASVALLTGALLILLERVSGAFDGMRSSLATVAGAVESAMRSSIQPGRQQQQQLDKQRESLLQLSGTLLTFGGHAWRHTHPEPAVLPLASLAVMVLQLAQRARAAASTTAGGAAASSLPASLFSRPGASELLALEFTGDVSGALAQVLEQPSGVMPSSSLDQQLLESQDLQLLMLVFFPVAVLGAGKQQAPPASSASSSPCSAAAQADSTAACGLLAALGLPGLAHSSAVESLRPTHDAADTLRAAARTALFSFFYRRQLSYVSAGAAGSAAAADSTPELQLPMPPGSVAALPLLETFVEAAALLPPEPEAPWPVLLVLPHLAKVVAANQPQWGNEPGPALTRMWRSVLWRLQPALAKQLQEHSKEHLAVCRELALGASNVLSALHPMDPGCCARFLEAVWALLTSRAAPPTAISSHLLVVEAALRGVGEVCDGYNFQGMAGFTQTLAVCAHGALLAPHSELGACIAADPALSERLFGVLVTRLKVVLLFRKTTVEPPCMVANDSVSIGLMILKNAVAVAEPGFAPHNRNWSPASICGVPASSSGGGDGRWGPRSVLLWVVAAGRALRFLSSELLAVMEDRTSALDEPDADHLQLQPFIGAVLWLGVVLPQLASCCPAAAAAAQLPQLLEQQAKLAAQLDLADAHALACTCPGEEVIMSEVFRSIVSPAAARAAMEFGGALCSAFPLPLCCNNPDCTELGQLTERQLVAPQRCSGCKVAKYCSSECQTAHWKAHKAACKYLQRQLKSGGSAAASTPTASAGPQPATAGGLALPVSAAAAASLSVRELKALCQGLSVAGLAGAVEKQDLVDLLVAALRLE